MDQSHEQGLSLRGYLFIDASLIAGLPQRSSITGQHGTTPHGDIPARHHHALHLLLLHLTHNQRGRGKQRGSGVTDRRRHQQSSGICKYREREREREQINMLYFYARY